MNPLLALLAALKLGVYVPAKDPFPAWFYLGTNFGVLEAGITEEYKRVRHTVLGLEGQKMVLKPAYFLGLRHDWSNDLDLSVGAKFSDRTSAYGAISFKFSTLLTGRKDLSPPAGQLPR